MPPLFEDLARQQAAMALLRPPESEQAELQDLLRAIETRMLPPVKPAPEESRLLGAAKGFGGGFLKSLVEGLRNLAPQPGDARFAALGAMQAQGSPLERGLTGALFTGPELGRVSRQTEDKRLVDQATKIIALQLRRAGIESGAAEGGADVPLPAIPGTASTARTTGIAPTPAKTITKKKSPTMEESVAKAQQIQAKLSEPKMQEFIKQLNLKTATERAEAERKGSTVAPKDYSASVEADIRKRKEDIMGYFNAEDDASALALIRALHGRLIDLQKYNASKGLPPPTTVDILEELTPARRAQFTDFLKKNPYQ
jgi:hypothetical protein